MPPAVFTSRRFFFPWRIISRTAAMGARFSVFPPRPTSAPSGTEVSASSREKSFLSMSPSSYFAALAAMCTASHTEAKGGA